MNHRQRLVENMFSLFVLQGANYIMPLITLPYLVRVLGPANFGLIAFAQAFSQYFVVITDYGFNLTATRQIALHAQVPRKVSEVFSGVMFIKLGLLVISCVVFAAIVFAVPRFNQDRALYWAVFLTVVGNAMFPTWFFQGMQQMKHITALNIFAKTMSVVAIFAFVHSKSDYVLAALIMSLGWIVTGVLGLATTRRVCPITLVIPSLSQTRDTLREGWHVFVANVSATVFGPTNIFILGLYASPEALGYFAIADKVVRAFIALSSPISASVYPRASELFAQSRKTAVAFLRKVMVPGGAVFLGLGLLLFVGADQIALLACGETNRTIVALVRIMAVLPLTVFIDNIYGTQVMLNIGMEKEFKRVLVFSALVSVALSLLLVPRIGAFGSAYAFVLSEFLLLVLMILPVHRAGIRIHRSLR